MIATNTWFCLLGKKKSLRFSAVYEDFKEIDRNEKNLSKNKIMTDTIVIGGSVASF
jgi:hypothetical protein